MYPNATENLLVKNIAMIMALLLLWIQVATAFHHHHSRSKIDQRTTLTVKINSVCTICHYMAHQAPAEPSHATYWLALAGILFMTITVKLLPGISSGFRFTALNKGPPVSSTPHPF